jgi:hypothetical protein
MDAGRKEGAEVMWRGSVPVSARFDDPYFSLEDGLAESRHVFLAGNGLPGRFRPGFHVAELGFGTGLNALAAWAAWREAGVPGDLRFTSFEAFRWRPGHAPGARRLAGDRGAGRDAAGGLASGVRRTAAAGAAPDGGHGRRPRDAAGLGGQADAWFLDGFGPAKNPEMWEPALMAGGAAHRAGRNLRHLQRRRAGAAGAGGGRLHGGAGAGLRAQAAHDAGDARP